MKSLNERLTDLFRTSSKLLILGIGENRMGDDGAGQFISFSLDERIKSPHIKIINGGILPEQRFDEIVQFHPDLILIIDAIQANRPPGTVELYEESSMRNYLPVSSHSIPLPVFLDKVKTAIKNVQLWLLGISPFSLQFSDRYELYREDIYTLDDFENNPNLPFYAFTLSKQMDKISKDVIQLLEIEIKKKFS